MTTGSYIDDIRTNPSGACSAYIKAGYYYRRTWSGDDSPPAPKPPQNFRDPWGNVIEWRRPVKRERRKPDHAYNCTIYSLYDPGVDKFAYGSTCKNTVQYTFGGLCYYTDPWSGNDEIALLSKLRTEIEGRDFSAGLMLGTADESLRTIFESAKRIGKAVDQVKRGNLLGAFTILKGKNNFSYRHRPTRAKIGKMERAILAIRRDRKRRPLSPEQALKHRSSDWLELQYGWLPLLSDTYDSGATLGHLMGAPLAKRYRARVWHDFSADVHPTSADATIGTVHATTGGQIIAHITEVDGLGLMGLTDPASLIWERLPWSFVADWFIPVQSWLSARALSSSLKGTYVKTRYLKVIGRGLYYKTPGSYPNYVEMNSPDCYEKYVTVNRTVGFNVPSPPLPVFKPLESIPSLRRCLNAVSLLVQRVF